MSPSGRFVLFESAASDLVATPDGHTFQDVFVRDLQTQTTTLVSVTASGSAAGHGHSMGAAISDDGRFVAFWSSANDLVAGDAGATDVFVRDLQTQTTTLVSVDDDGNQGNSNSHFPLPLRPGLMSPEGRFVLFGSDATDLAPGDLNGASDVFLRDRQLGTTTLVSAATDGGSGNARAQEAALTEDGRFVVLISRATDLAAGDDLNGVEDVFVRDMQAAATVLASGRGPLPPPLTGNYGSSTNAISGDGRHVLFTSFAEDLVSDDGNRTLDVFLRDLETGTTVLASRNAAGTGSADRASMGVDLSLGGRYVLFDSTATDLVGRGPWEFVGDVYRRDVQAGTTALVSVTPGGAPGDGYSTGKAITPSGRYVLFDSSAPDLVAGDGNDLNDVFLRDMQTGVTELVSINPAGSGSGNGESWAGAVTPNGRFVLFTSRAADLVSTPSPYAWLDQVYVRDRQTETTILISVNAAGTAAGRSSSYAKAITPDGSCVLFDSGADDLVAGDFNGSSDVFVRDLQAGTTTLVSRNRWGTGTANHWSGGSGLTNDGRYVVFVSFASDLVPNDGTTSFDVTCRRAAPCW